MANPGHYSFAWSGQFEEERSLDILLMAHEAKSIPEFFDELHGEIGNNFQGFGQNVVLADTSGNIGYKLLMSIPERSDKTPFIGSRVLDGTTTKFDWTGKAVDLKDLPYGMNPKKGFYQTANGKQTSGNAINDYGAGVNSPARSLRIDEVLREKIASGKKITLADMGALQQDVHDVFARKMVPLVIKITRDIMKDSFSGVQQGAIEDIIGVLGTWDANFDEESIGATIFTRW